MTHIHSLHKGRSFRGPNSESDRRVRSVAVGEILHAMTSNNENGADKHSRTGEKSDVGHVLEVTNERGQKHDQTDDARPELCHDNMVSSKFKYDSLWSQATCDRRTRVLSVPPRIV